MQYLIGFLLQVTHLCSTSFLTLDVLPTSCLIVLLLFVREQCVADWGLSNAFLQYKAVTQSFHGVEAASYYLGDGRGVAMMEKAAAPFSVSLILSKF